MLENSLGFCCFDKWAAVVNLIWLYNKCHMTLELWSNWWNRLYPPGRGKRWPAAVSQYPWWLLTHISLPCSSHKLLLYSLCTISTIINQHAFLRMSLPPPLFWFLLQPHLQPVSLLLSPSLSLTAHTQDRSRPAKQHKQQKWFDLMGIK